MFLTIANMRVKSRREFEDDQNDQQDGGSGVPGELAVQVVVVAPRPGRGCAGGEAETERSAEMETEKGAIKTSPVFRLAQQLVLQASGTSLSWKSVLK